LKEVLWTEERLGVVIKQIQAQRWAIERCALAVPLPSATSAPFSPENMTFDKT